MGRAGIGSRRREPGEGAGGGVSVRGVSARSELRARPAGLARTRPAAGLRGRVQGRRGRLASRPLSAWLRYRLSSLAVARLRDRVVARPPRGHAVERPTDHAVARLRGRPRGRAVANLAIMMQFSLEQRDALSLLHI